MQADPTVVYATDSMALDDLATGKWPNYLFWDTLGVADLATRERQPGAAVTPDLPAAGPARTGPSPRPRGPRSRPPSTPTSARTSSSSTPAPGRTRTRSPRPPRSTAATSPSAECRSPDGRRDRRQRRGGTDCRRPERWRAADRARSTAPPGAPARAPGRDGLDAYFGLRPENARYLTGFVLGDGEEKVAGPRAGSSSRLTSRSCWPTRATASRPTRSARPAASRTWSAPSCERLAGAAGEPATDQRAPRTAACGASPWRPASSSHAEWLRLAEARAGRGARARRGAHRGAAPVKEPAELERIARRLRRRRRGPRRHAAGHPRRASRSTSWRWRWSGACAPAAPRAWPSTWPACPARARRCPTARPASGPCAAVRCCSSTSGPRWTAIAPT